MMRRTAFRHIDLATLVFGAILAAGASVGAQSTGTLLGTVTDTQNAVMPGVSITIKNTATGIERTTATDSAGEYVAASLSPGHYQIVAHIQGFEDQSREVDLAPAQTIAVNVKLGVAALAENVNVSGAAPLIDTA
ncbi:MAG TPA: carboxypeptidase-like regulatory domain-containing protein, partial [Vicinamibacterales bacterium]|nr:carboxypeptidase-like regulatory domain-containing protein [Vicinamibacterales bacterium]